jgi:hypothetical protein
VLVALPAASLFDDSCFVTWTGDGGARYGNLEGTSFAAPEVAGIAALIWAARPELKNYQVADIIKQSARRSAPDWTPELGCGILDAGAALELATSRPASAWTGERADGARCSAAGPLPATWPSEINQTITFRPLRNRTLGDPDFAVTATTSSGLPVSFTATGDCRISRTTVHITDAGACVVTAAQAGDAHHNFATSVSRSFLIAPPRVLAFAASGRWGTELHLPFKVGIARGSVSVGIDVQRKGASISQLERSLSIVESRKVYTLAWRAPAAQASGPYRFCVALSDPSGVPGRRSCAPIHLR